MFDFRLQVFYTVAKRLSFTKAAKELFITQPAVTKHIHETEKQLGIKLFDRNGTKIALTPAGTLLLQHAEKIFALHREMEFEMAALRNTHSGSLHIGASTTIAQYILPPILAQFHKRFSDVSARLFAHNTERIEQALEKGSIDLGIIEGHGKNLLFKYIPFIKDELVLAVRPGHKLAATQEISLAQLTQLPLLMREPGSGTLEVIAHALEEHNLKLSQLKTEMELGSTEAMKLYLRNSDAAAFLSIHSITEDLKQNLLTVIDIKGFAIERQLCFIQKHGEESAIANLFINFALRYNLK